MKHGHTHVIVAAGLGNWWNEGLKVIRIIVVGVTVFGVAVVGVTVVGVTVVSVTVSATSINFSDMKFLPHSCPRVVPCLLGYTNFEA